MVDLISKVITISKKKTSIRLAQAEWDALEEIMLLDWTIITSR